LDIKSGKAHWFGHSHAQLGMSSDETSGSPEEFWDHVHKAEREKLRSAMAAAREKHAQFNEEFRVVWRDGTIRWLRSRGRCYYAANGEPERLLGISSDITEHKRAEETLFRYADLIESSDDAIISKDLDALITSWNAAAQRIFGYSEKEAIGQPITILIPPDLWDEENKILVRLRAGQRIEHFDTIRVTKAGKKINVSLTISPIRDATGKITGYSKIARDITERKRAEEILFRYAAIVESSDEAISSVTLDGVTVTWNAGAERMFGYTESEAVGKHASIIVPPELRDQQKELLQTLRAGGRIEQFETVRVTKTGKRIDVSLSIFPVKDSTGKIVGFAGVARDVTKRKRAEEALLSSEQRYRLLFERNLAGVGMTSLDGQVLDCNDGWARILGCESRDEVIGRNAAEFYFHPPDRQQLLEELLENQAVFSRELQMRQKDGSPVWVLFNAAALNSEHNIPILQSTIIDISDRKRAEEALSGMTRKLIEAQEQERARIARELHDDVSQRLALLAVELDQWDHSSPDSPDLHSHLEHAKGRISDLAHDVQNLSHQLHSSKLEYLGLVVAARSFSKEISEKNDMSVDFREHGVPHSLPKEVSLSLFRILQQALHNAVEHSGAKNIEVRLWEDSNEVHLTVKDSGRGFDLLSAMQGGGLGLTSMRERARLVNGDIAIDSKPMHGTSIHVRVPIDSEVFDQRKAV
jgi:PAS domain S-box-containing protein